MYGAMLGLIYWISTDQFSMTLLKYLVIKIKLLRRAVVQLVNKFNCLEYDWTVIEIKNKKRYMYNKHLILMYVEVLVK